MKQTQDSFMSRAGGWVKSHATWDNAMKVGAVAGGAVALGGAGAALMSAESLPAAAGAVSQGLTGLGQLAFGKNFGKKPDRVWSAGRGWYDVYPEVVTR